MIITRSPLRITLGGGGTDLPSYYRQHGGFVASAAINKYIFITLHEVFSDELIIKYSELERVQCVEDIKHPIVREALKLVALQKTALEIGSFADIPAGSGLGSSSSFTTALLQALHHHEKNIVDRQMLAEQACEIEIQRLCEPIGKQDQYISSYGSLMCFEFHPDDRVTTYPLALDDHTRHTMEDNLVLYFTGYSRRASSILQEQQTKTLGDDQGMIDNLHTVKDLGRRSVDALLKGDLRQYAKLMHEHWCHKKKRSDRMSNPKIDAWYQLGMDNGALGGKLIGAGGGGFLMFYSEHKTQLRQAMKHSGLREVRFGFDNEGSKVVLSE